MENKACLAVEGSFVPVDEHQAFAPVIVDEAGCRIHRQAGASHDQKIRMINGSDAVLQRLGIQTFFIENHIGLHCAAAGAFGNTGRIPDELGAVEFSAALAVVSQDAAVEFTYIFRTCLLVQSIDVLGHNGRELPFLFPSCQNFVGDIWFMSKRQHFLPVESIEIFRSAEEEAMGNDLLRRILKFLVVQSIYAAEIRNAGFGADTGTAEKDDAATFVDPYFKLFNLIHEIIPLYLYSRIVSNKKQHPSALINRWV